MSRLVVACLLWASAAHAQSAIQPFLTELDRALQSADRAAVAASVRYPIVVSIGGIRVPFRDAKTLLDRYDEIFTPELREVVARGPAAAVETPDGFLLGNNVLAIAQVGGQLKITAVVVPPAEPVPESSSSPSSLRTGGSREPRRISLRAGPRPTRFAGLLPPGAADSYVFFVSKGQLLEVRVERVRGEAVVRVVNAATGAPLNPRVAQGALLVSGRAQASADYRIEVQRTSPGDSDLPYMLAVSMR
ncbi:MAG: hypothetical protein EHM55_09255 [Acidobacteria bacterium]|nr:MAG: hypothetical protein EHM55_09255 [Acidobacteriota bacterium]